MGLAVQVGTGLGTVPTLPASEQPQAWASIVRAKSIDAACDAK